MYVCACVRVDVCSCFPESQYFMIWFRIYSAWFKWRFVTFSWVLTRNQKCSHKADMGYLFTVSSDAPAACTDSLSLAWFTHSAVLLADSVSSVFAVFASQTHGCKRLIAIMLWEAYRISDVHLSGLWNQNVSFCHLLLVTCSLIWYCGFQKSGVMYPVSVCSDHRETLVSKCMTNVSQTLFKKTVQYCCSKDASLRQLCLFVFLTLNQAIEPAQCVISDSIPNTIMER